MSYNIEYRPEENIVITTTTSPFDVIAEIKQIGEELSEILNSTEDNLYYIADLRNVKLSFSEMMIGMADAYKVPDSPYLNPRLKSYTVSQDTLLEIGTKAANEQEQYGQLEIKIYKTVEEAIADINIAKAQNTAQ